MKNNHPSKKQEPTAVETPEIGIVTIDPHYCHRNDFKDLIAYLEKKCWDYKVTERSH